MLSIIQYTALAISIIGAFFVTWSLSWTLVAIFFFYLYGIIGMSLMLHRYWSHKSFEFRNKMIEKLFIFISIISCRGSPIAWAHIHRTHHANSDTEKDPHRPSNFRFLSFKSTYIETLKIFLIKDLMTTEQKVIHEYYLLFILFWCGFLFLVNPYLLYFGWALPVFINQIVQDLWNYYSHINSGYRNFETNDNSRNVIWLWPLILGEAWHNNHHHNPRDSTRILSYEFDPVMYIIQAVKK